MLNLMLAGCSHTSMYQVSVAVLVYPSIGIRLLLMGVIGNTSISFLSKQMSRLFSILMNNLVLEKI